jgi:hypothetical protein
VKRTATAPVKLVPLAQLKHVIRVFPRRTSQTPVDPLAFVGAPPLYRPDADEVHVSVTFTWDKPEAERLAEHWRAFYPVVRIGGPAYGDRGGEFTAGRYVKEGVTSTSRGCPNACDFCVVPEREGRLRELPIVPGWIVQDNNLTACSDRHVDAVFSMLRSQPYPAQFAGGLEAARIGATWVDRLRSIRLGQLFLAYDKAADAPDVQRAAILLRSALPRDKCRCFVLIGRGADTQEAARRRCEQAWEWGLLPFAMLYRDETGARPDGGWRQLQRTFSRPAATKAYFKVAHA